MSDSIDRVFVKAITTIRALSSRSSYGLLPRPPAENRIKLYGLYKQATEGNVQGTMSRPEGHTMEDEGAKKKWDAWKREERLSKTEAKRQYIIYLISTMRVYASGTSEARELLSELEYLWDQIKDLAYTEDDTYTYLNPSHPFTDSLVQPPLVHSYMDRSDRFSVGTPWPLPSTGSISASQQFKNNSEQIYLHSRRNTRLLLNDSAVVPEATRISAAASTLEDFRTWQGHINLIINKLSRDFASRRGTHNPCQSDSESESCGGSGVRTRLLRLLRCAAGYLAHLTKNMSISVFAILFVLWCVNRNVVIRRTIVKKQSDGKSLKELVINMVINTDENKWFVRILAFINSVVGFV
ncbi:hypothetical protein METBISCDRAFT_32258 [Metschnikowia bicuspidata]|uniref:ACB domain-containing protein n=1 Tax=Metschnikowia bicuspidata TaxID=27322 RepID=A0A4P9Z8T5_9ASCO|nr:hypothetical protein METBISCDRAFT_32258 [Metschnikowia bicuspidata]